MPLGFDGVQSWDADFASEQLEWRDTVFSFAVPVLADQKTRVGVVIFRIHPFFSGHIGILKLGAEGFSTP